MTGITAPVVSLHHFRSQTAKCWSAWRLLHRGHI